MAASFGTATSRIQLALQSTLQYRCEEIARVIKELGTKELQNALPLLLADLFGISSGGAVLSPNIPPCGTTVSNTGQGVGWGLRTLLHSSEFTDYNVLYQFLHPQGPVFNLLYRLMQDCHLKYEFPLHFLPPRVKQMILTGIVPPFYADKLQLDPQTRVPVCLALNPFEFYIFHFAYHLVNPELQRSQSTTWQYADSLYLSLIDVYLSELLPCDRSHVTPAVPYMNTIPPLAIYGLRRPAVQSPTKTLNTSQLFRQSILQQSSTPGSLHSSQSASTSSSHTEIWRSETVAQVFVDFWLNYGESDTNVYGRATPPRSPLHHYFPAERPSPFKLPLKYPELLPTAEHICVVRNLIKYLHYFSNSEASDGSAMDELRKVIVPSSQARIYAFLRRTIHRWPLDSSFRFILETWLSYIQPWRYTDHRFRNDLQAANVDGEGNNLERRGVEYHWLPFIANNLLSYTVIFREILPRFARLDLSTPKNASMLFRVSKVFSQPMLCKFVREVEATLEEPAISSIRCNVDSPESTHHTIKWAATVRQQIQDLEIPGFQYKLMFGAETRAQVLSLLYIVRQSQAVADATQRSLQQEAEKKARARSVLSRVRDWFVVDSSTAEEYSPEERVKVSMYLQSTMTYMCTIFGISENELPEDSRLVRDATDGLGENSNRCETPTGRGTNAGVPSPSVAFLTLKPTPQQWKQRALNITYEGDPDQLPIRSDESAMMVRLLYQISCRLNELYGQDMNRLYNLNNVWGRVARLILLPPIRVRRFNKIPGSFSPCVETPLPPRLSLRPLSRHMFLLGLPALCTVASVSNISPLLALFLAFLVWALYIFAQALLQPYCQAPRREVRRIDFNDSFLNESVGNVSF